MKKILIIGNSGSGKSWLSKQLSRKLQLQEVNLDSIVWEPGGYNQKRSTGAIENEIASIKSQCNWVVEGVFGALAEQLIFLLTCCCFWIWSGLNVKVFFMLVVRRARSNLMRNRRRRIFVNY
ncbi:hypothetical protein [Vibrio parahaemolyticus]|uniref:hypothetical protein n=1 Tax=Vibrio parahaemolyticus TaxID=670 RepID=UPI0023620FD4|nr:hypothetical protein [Vibrio parahaemolyticus]